MKALNERLDRDKNPAADPPFLSPAWAERLRAGTLSTQTTPASPSTVKTTSRSKPRDVPFAFERECIRTMGPRTPERKTMPSLEIGSGASKVPPSNPSGLSALLPDVTPTIAPTASPATPSNVTGKSISVDKVDKNAQDSTPVPEPSEPNKSDVDLAAQVSGATSYARFFGTSRLDVPSLPDALAHVQTTTPKKDSRDSKPSEPDHSVTGLAAQVSGTVSYARFLGTSSPEVSSRALEDGSPNTTKKASRAPKPSRRNVADADLTAQISGTASKASLLARTGLVQEAVLASSRHTKVVAQLHLNVFEEIRGRFRSEIGGVTTQRQGALPDPIGEEFPSSSPSSEISTLASFPPQAPCPADHRPDLGRRDDASTSTTFVTVKPPSDAPVQVANGRILREAPKTKKQKQKKVMAFSEEVQVRDFPMSKENQEARLSVKPIRKRRQGARKTARKEEEQSEVETGMEWVPTLTPAPVIAQSPGDDVIMQDLSISQQQRAMKESERTAANLPPDGAGTGQIMEQPQAPIPMDMDVEMVPYSLPQASLQSGATPRRFKWQAQVRREEYGITYQRRYSRRRTACFGF
ncbi:hypothetical protein M407DRAFT_30369 [Tulasnella calospora MUT 4182]|uniref:Uncharacterized protein n=1 Tax=Tulasnella calospora MUT 4182 TaxID=1051891 RepID=A0A0C3PXV2_9AGAM|nr:hypothetical protein M407DRAFT_30369 [Tulasnella calospora MUT 4182]